MEVYPIKFNPIFKHKVWGGNKLKELLNKPVSEENIGESWEISGVKDNVTKVANGIYQNKGLNDLVREFKSKFLGEENFIRFGEEFPLLIKFIDAKENLSVQLHPDDDLARERHNSFGKNEMWYLIDTEADSVLNLGLKKNVQEAEVLHAIQNNSLVDLLNFQKVNQGDSYFIKAGKIHAIGAGIVLAEIQQTSDVTYRIYDWERVDSNGLSRELHLKEAKEAIDYDSSYNFGLPYTYDKGNLAELISCKYFTTNIILVDKNYERDISHIDSFVIYICTEGELELKVQDYSLNIKMGECILLPALSKLVEFSPYRETKLLEVFI